MHVRNTIAERERETTRTLFDVIVCFVRLEKFLSNLTSSRYKIIETGLLPRVAKGIKRIISKVR